MITYNIQFFDSGMFFGIGLNQLGEASFSCEDFLWSVRFKACRVRGLHEEVGAQGIWESDGRNAKRTRLVFRCV